MSKILTGISNLQVDACPASRSEFLPMDLRRVASPKEHPGHPRICLARLKPSPVLVCLGWEMKACRLRWWGIYLSNGQRWLSFCGHRQVVRHQLPKLTLAGSSPVARSRDCVTRRCKVPGFLICAGSARGTKKAPGRAQGLGRCMYGRLTPQKRGSPNA